MQKAEPLIHVGAPALRTSDGFAVRAASIHIMVNTSMNASHFLHYATAKSYLTFLLIGRGFENIDSTTVDNLVVVRHLSCLQHSTSIHQTFSEIERR